MRAMVGCGGAFPRGNGLPGGAQWRRDDRYRARTAAKRGNMPGACIQWAGDDPAASYLQASRRAADGDLRRNQTMRIFVFGSSITSSYWNGAATYYRGMYKNLAALGYEITFAEPDIFNRQQNPDLS